jgi:hypothetical protein
MERSAHERFRLRRLVDNGTAQSPSSAILPTSLSYVIWTFSRVAGTFRLTA